MDWMKENKRQVGNRAENGRLFLFVLAAIVLGLMLGGTAPALANEGSAPANTPPTISGLVNQTVAEDTTLGPLAFTVGDAETAAGALQVFVSSSNTVLFPSGRMTLAGSGSARTITLNPAAERSGTALITLIVSDGAATAQTSFLVTVTPVDDPPTITGPGDKTIESGRTLGPLAVSLNDIDTTLSNLTLTATSSDPVMLPASAFVFGGSGGARTVSITPVAGLTGNATVTLTVSDGTSTASAIFTLTVIPRNQSPTVSTISDREVNEDESLNVTFVVTDAETNPDNLIYSVSSSNQAVIPNLNLILGGSGENRLLSITPTPNQNGSVIISLTVSDGEFSVSRTFRVTVRPVDDPPTIGTLITQVTQEDTPIQVSLIITDVDTPVSQLTISGSSTNQVLVTDNNVAVKSSGNSRSLLITPEANQFGSTVILATVSDGTNFAVASFQLIVTPVNDAPMVVPFANQRINEDTVFGPFVFIVQDVESPSTALTATATAANTTLITTTNVTVTGSGISRSITITPTENAFGASFVTIEVGDGEDVGRFTFTLFVDSVNDRPFLEDLPDVSTPEDTPLTIKFKAWDVETPFSQLLYSADSSNPALVPVGNLQFTRTSTENRLRMSPLPDLFGTTTISVTVSDGQLATTKSFVLTVDSVNDPPVVSTPPNLTTPQGISVTTSLTVGDRDTPLDALIFTFASSNPALFPDGSIRVTGSGSQRTVILDPAPGVFGVANITITVDDGTDKVASLFKVTVLAPPTIAAIGDQTTDEDVPLLLEFTVNDPDTDLRVLRINGITGNPTLVPLSNISFAGTGNTRTATIVPAVNLSGTAPLTITVGDGNLTAAAAFQLTVRPVNDAPVIAAVAPQLIDQDETGTVTLNLSDVDSDVSTITLKAVSSSPDLFPANRLHFAGSGASRTLSFTPFGSRNGIATITVTASDGAAESSISFEVTVNGAPSFVGLADVQVAEDSAETLNFTIADPDLDPAGLHLSVSAADQSLIRNETLVLGGSGAERSLKIAPEPNRHGTTVITLVADDGRLRTSFAFRVTVLPVNDAPTIGRIEPQVTDEDALNGPVPFAVGDIDSPLEGLQLFGTSTDPTLLPHTAITFGGEGANRTVSLMPAPDLSGQVGVTVTVSDGALHASTFYTLTVLPVNDAPVIAPIGPQVTPEDSSLTVTFQVSDIDSPLSDVTISARSEKQSLVRDAGLVVSGSGAERTITITPEADQEGATRIVLKASDGSLTSERAFDLTVDGGNDGPILEPVADQSMDEDTVLGVNLSLYDIDTPLEQLQLTVTSSDRAIVPANGFWIEGVGELRTLYIQPAKDRNGSLTVTVDVTDGEYLFTRSFRLTVRPVNDPPVAVDDQVRVITAPSINIGVLANDWDVDRDPLQVVAVSPGAYGAISINSDNTLRYLMPPNFIGEEVIEYTIDDGQGERASARLTIRVINAPGESGPSIKSVEPRSWDNDTSVDLTVGGLNFTGPAQASLGPYPLLDVRVADSTRLTAIVPAFLPPGRYDLIVRFAGGETVVRRADFAVTTRGVAVTDVRPNRTEEGVPLLINVYGLNFGPDAVALLDDQPLQTIYLSSSHVQAMIPGGLAAPGVYPVTVRRGDGLQATQADAFTIYASNSDDLFAFPFELWSEPGALYVGQSVQLGLRVHRQASGDVMLDVPVAFYNGEPGPQTYLGRVEVPLLTKDDRANTRSLTWTPPSAGNHTIYAVIDPDNRIAESNENNNILRRSFTVLPTAVDMTAPLVHRLTIRDGMVTTDSPDVEIAVEAEDSGYGVRAIFLVEYEYARGAGRWTPVQWSGWLDYPGTPTVYPWKLLPSPGARYVLAWAADNAGNLSALPAVGLINYAHAHDDKVEAGETRLYRYGLEASEQMLAFAIPGQGDPDLYVWPPDHQSRGPWVTNLQDAVDEIGFVAPVTGVYQMEVTGYTPATYRTVVEIRAGGPRLAPANNSNLDPSKALRTKPFVPVSLTPFERYGLPLGPLSLTDPPVAPPPDPRPAQRFIFLPTVQR